MDMDNVLLAYAPVLLFGALFFRSFWREPRQFRNGIFLSFSASVHCSPTPRSTVCSRGGAYMITSLFMAPACRGDKPTPLLRGRIDKAVASWKKQGRKKNHRFRRSGG